MQGDLILLGLGVGAMLTGLGVMGALIDRHLSRKHPDASYRWHPCRVKEIVHGDREPDAWEIIEERRSA